MGLNKFASHYLLAPDGSFIKWPVVVIDEGGEVRDVYAHPGGFREEPGVRFFSGLMLPAFIDWQMSDGFFQEEPSRLLNRHFSRGTLYLLCSSVPEAIKKRKNQWPRVLDRGNLFENPTKIQGKVEEQKMPVFDRIVRSGIASNETPLAEIFTKATSVAARNAGLPNAGQIAPGCVPGLILIQNLDLINLKLQMHSTIKWLNVPDVFKEQAID